MNVAGSLSAKLRSGIDEPRILWLISSQVNDYATASAEKAAYLEYWSYNASSLESQGCYEWMASQLDYIQPKKVFDIGCGAGEGVLALHRRFDCDIVSIDENLPCLRRAYRLLRSNGITATLRSRFSYHQNPDGTHSTLIEKAPIKATDRVNLVQADPFFEDPIFGAYLRTQVPFDVVTVWLIGAYQCRQTCADLSSLRMAQPQEYRLHVQNRTYILASKLLRPGGVLQVVDRGEPLESEELREDHLNGHREQAALGDLRVLGATSRQYNEQPTRKGVEMVLSTGKSGRVPNLEQTVLASVLSVKS